MFVHIRGRGTYSMLEWIGSHSQIFQVAKDLWQTSIAITDLYGLYGLIDFYTKSKNFDIKPLLWVELPYVPRFASLSLTRWVAKELGTLTFLISNKLWYHNMLRLVSSGYEHMIDEIPCIDNEMIAKYSEWLIVLIWGLWSFIYNALVVRNDNLQAKNHIEWLLSLFNKDSITIDITAQSYLHYPQLKQSNDFLISQAKEYGLPMVTSSSYYYPYQTQKIAYETALAIKDGKKNYDSDARKIKGDHHILSEQEVRFILEWNSFSETMIEDLINATGELADRCRTKITLSQALFPNYNTPDVIKNLYEQHKDYMIESS